MQNRWSDAQAQACIEKYGKKYGADHALRVYLSTLIGTDDKLVLHGGGNSSVKTTYLNIFGEKVESILVKASGQNMASMGPEGFTRLDLEYLKRLRNLSDLPDELMLNEFGCHLFDARAAAPSIETLVHAFIPAKFIDHSHADAILTLTNQVEGRKWLRHALGEDVYILDYVEPGFRLAQAAAAAYESNPGCRAMVWIRHGLLTWGETARESYDRMIEVVTRAEELIARKTTKPCSLPCKTSLECARERLTRLAPIMRGLLAQPSADHDNPFKRVILQPLVNREILDFVDAEGAKALALTGPLTSDHLIRTKALPLWLDDPEYDDPERFREQLAGAIRAYAAAYENYLERHRSSMPAGVQRFDSLPRVLLLPGMGAVGCGRNVQEAGIVRDIAAHTLAVKAAASAMGTYVGLNEDQLFEMEYRGCQHSKLGPNGEQPLGRQTALITGAAGAIGSGIAGELLANGCHVTVTDLPGPRLEALLTLLRKDHGERVMAVPMDVTDAGSVAAAFAAVAENWGGVDIVIPNAGLAHVASLTELDLESFRRLERVNVEGTLHILAEAARHFKVQGTQGDIILISTKNVFFPGAGFGAYSATKSAAHQLARIASLELAAIGVRVNMVSPDAVFSNEGIQSGLWAEVGPARMKARGLDARGLEEYYRSRNLLKSPVTSRHVAKAVLFFATRQTPTTGATIPVDGGLPDSTPR
jgi:rhamnose utilization protein RhaD (predicted bifunctional aldolase and dehydrogenase)/NAD(P)-dependent dehydrogenase (short-subunit alcohol dehydrogenase family)